MLTTVTRARSTSAILYVLSALVLVASVAVWPFRQASSKSRPYRHLAALEGRSLPFVTLRDSASKLDTVRLDDGSAHVLYAFLTSCPSCKYQRDSIARLLKLLPSDMVVAISPEPAGVLANYWKPYTGFRSGSLLESPGFTIQSVPMLLCIDGGGIVSSVIVGDVRAALAGSLVKLSGRLCPSFQSTDGP